MGAGISRNKLSEITNGNLSFADIDHTSWKALAGVRPLSFLGVEADYMDLGSGSGSLFQPGSGGQSSTHSDAKAFAAYAVGFLPVPVPFLDLYAKAGLSRWKLEGDTTTRGTVRACSPSRATARRSPGAPAHRCTSAPSARGSNTRTSTSPTPTARRSSRWTRCCCSRRSAPLTHTQTLIGGTTSTDARAFAAYGVGFLPLPVPWLDVFGKAGVARWKLSGDTNSAGTLPPSSFFGFSDRGTDFAWGVGARPTLATSAGGSSTSASISRALTGLGFSRSRSS